MVNGHFALVLTDAPLIFALQVVILVNIHRGLRPTWGIFWKMSFKTNIYAFLSETFFKKKSLLNVILHIKLGRGYTNKF